MIRRFLARLRRRRCYEIEIKPTWLAHGLTAQERADIILRVWPAPYDWERNGDFR